MNLTAERLNRGLTIEAMAQEIGVREHVLRYAEQGGRPHPGSRLRIATYLGVNVTDLWPVETEEDAA